MYKRKIETVLAGMEGKNRQCKVTSNSIEASRALSCVSCLEGR